MPVDRTGRGEKSGVRITIEAGASDVLNRLERAGFQAYVVGGCVRDAILGRVPHDWDICTDAAPEEVVGVFGKKWCIPTGIRHGTVSVRQRGTLYEVTTFRTESGYSDGRHPDSVSFIHDVKDDLARRDFTVNAMAYSEKEGLVDPFGGYEDLLRRQVIRAVGVPRERFEEDALRILRLYRFAARFAFQIDPDTERAAVELAPNLKRISAERIHEELTKLLLSDEPSSYLKPEIVRVFLPELVTGGRLDGRMLRRVDRAERTDELRYAALLMDVGDDAAAPDRTGQVCRLSSDTLRAGQETLRTAAKLGQRGDCGPADSDVLRDVADEDTGEIRQILPDRPDRQETSFSDRVSGGACTGGTNRQAKPHQGMLCEPDEAGAAMAEEILKRLRCSNDFIRTVCGLVRWHRLLPAGNESERVVQARRLVHLLKEENARRLVRLCAAEARARGEEGCREPVSAGQPEEESLIRLKECPEPVSAGQPEDFICLEDCLDEVLASHDCCSVGELALRGTDLMEELGLPKGRMIGKLLDSLLEEVICGRLPNERETLLDEAKSLIYTEKI